ncbi:unnamed protein product [Moneuplotes crassus]|uniref:Uncharacterized protein n=1 Tax=Euplotes crassus TaxID=5936 RepID=A0AAD2D3V4_EUPCR|nr:unnamed protein product [Moneuplotes crassus]
MNEEGRSDRSESMDKSLSSIRSIDGYSYDQGQQKCFEKEVAIGSTMKLLQQLIVAILVFDVYYGYFYLFLYSNHPSAVIAHKLDRVARLLMGAAGVLGIVGYRKLDTNERYFSIYLKTKIVFSVILPLSTIVCRIYDCMTYKWSIKFPQDELCPYFGYTIWMIFEVVFWVTQAYILNMYIEMTAKGKYIKFKGLDANNVEMMKVKNP